jgi:hypothetical protein
VTRFESLRRRAVGWAATRTCERLCVAALLALLAGQLVLTSLGKRLSYDEPYHLDYGYRFLTEGPGARVRERLPVMALSALGCVADGCERELLNASEGRRLLVRAPTMVFALGLGLLLYAWVRQTLGLAAARLTLVLYVFNPTILAHGKQVTGDVATAFFATAALYAAWCFARRPGAVPFLLAALATTGAALSKYTALQLLPLLPVLVLRLPRHVHSVERRRLREHARAPRRGLGAAPAGSCALRPGLRLRRERG